jgi:ADP-ribose pyrophosphatase YjhB (NUDIX family)
VDYGESLEEALVRELREEVSLTAEIGPLLFVNDSIAPDGSRHLIQLVFRVDIEDSAVVKLGIDKRVVEAKFVTWEEIQKLTIRPDLKKEFSDLLNKGLEANLNYLGRRWLN